MSLQCFSLLGWRDKLFLFPGWQSCPMPIISKISSKEAKGYGMLCTCCYSENQPNNWIWSLHDIAYNSQRIVAQYWEHREKQENVSLESSPNEQERLWTLYVVEMYLDTSFSKSSKDWVTYIYIYWMPPENQKFGTEWWARRSPQEPTMMAVYVSPLRQ